MELTPTHKLTTFQFITAAIAVLAAAAIAVKHELADAPLDIFAAVVGIGSLTVGLWQEVAKVRHIAEARTVQQIMNALRLDDHLTNSPDHIAILEWLLKPPMTGMDAVLRGLILKQAAVHRNFCRIELDKPGEENSRILALGDVIRKADHYVYAFTYGEPAYIIDFWEKPSTLRDYYEAHKDALEKKGRKFQLQRVFVVTDELWQNPRAYEIFVNTVKKLRELGMNDIFVVDETLALEQLGRVPKRSFFVADDLFVSESEARGIVATGYVEFSSSGADQLKRIFSGLRLAAGQPISDEQIAQLGRMGDSRRSNPWPPNAVRRNATPD